MKRKKRLFVWILAAMLLFSQLLVYAAEPGREKETGRVEERTQTKKTDQKEKPEQEEPIQKEKTEQEETGEKRQPKDSTTEKREEDREVEEPDFPLGKDCKGEVIGTAVAEDGASLYSTPGSMATITPGTDHAYGSWATCEFSIATETGTHMGYCAEPNSPTPSGEYRVSVLNHDTIKSLLLLAPGSELYSEKFWNSFGFNPATGGVDGKNDAFSLAHACIGYAYNGSTTGLSEVDVQEIRQYIAEAEAMRSNPQFPNYTVYIAYNDQQDIVWLEKNQQGRLKLKKSSANPEITNGSSCYSLAGAKYGVFSDEGCSQGVGELVTDEAGDTPELVLQAGTYYCEELEAPKGYALDQTVHKVEVTANQTAELKVTDVPQMDPVGVLLGKVDQETNQNKPQGSASLEGAEFTMKCYAVDPSTNGGQDPAEQGHQPKRAWVFRTDKDGFCEYSTQFFVRGDELYLSPGGVPSLPMGVVTLQETKAPEGYLLNPTVYVIPITSENNGSEFVYTYNAPTIPESILSLEIIKKEKGIDRPIPGVVFTHTDPDGKKTDVTTNEKGSVTLKGMSRGTHTIQEKSVPAGYTKNPGVVKFKVDENNKITEVGNTSTEASGKMILTLKPDGTAQLSVEDILAPYRLLLHKENDKGKLLEGAEFTLYADRECKKELQRQVTDTKGTLAFPNLQVNTKYYLKETKAPEGYRIPVGADGAPVVYEIYTKSNPVTGSFEYYVNGTKHTETSGDFAITGTKQDREVNLKVVNIIGLQMPETGSTGTLLLLLIGAGCLGVAVYQYRKGGKKHEKE
ncbi:MSCRAMM family protein [Faecalimonas umbilicata]|uniref:MSCRAMM family protein n=1 Tax=Faecalimonas umbilicata TaxID=1912855 RepID=UPI0022E2B410|nr:SpaA isopeptide-forming pilin-related protein [Faecalimonas umbilicata]